MPASPSPETPGRPAPGEAAASDGAGSLGSPGRLAVLVTAAGSSTRFGGGKKELLEIEGRSVLDRALAAFVFLEDLAGLVITAPKGGVEAIRSSLSTATLAALGRRLRIVEGGETRRDSVRLGLEALAATLEPALGTADLSETIVLVHDGARPWATGRLARLVAETARERGAAIPVLPLVDTPKRLSREGLILEHPERASLGGAQTPQGFRLLPLLEAHRRALAEGLACTDDAELWARYVGPVAWVEGEKENRKITFREDLVAAPGEFRAAFRADGETPGSGRREGGASVLPFRIGEGWDLHRLVPGRRLMIGGIEVPADFGEEAHSDGDVLLHAIVDALLGAAALGDIGSHFPPSDARWKDADSAELAARAAALVREAGYEPANLDCTVILERPKLGPHRQAIRESIAAVVGLPLDAVSFKAKTSEGVDAAGEGRAIEARAVVLLGRSN
ncbi:MAG: 2-C-methyl-D-erythritol 2,4-cyclodiphosphate synthase [Spirochaetaceae bacterium]|nr:2-C-methyl-D-erythritol 2,4-cyclodiphosphate synthase [Spirochaetaceae bacterium]